MDGICLTRKKPAGKKVSLNLKYISMGKQMELIYIVIYILPGVEEIEVLKIQNHYTVAMFDCA